MKHELFLINHLLLMTGLSERTIRSYIASGILEGEKSTGSGILRRSRWSALLPTRPCAPASAPDKIRSSAISCWRIKRATGKCA